MLIEQDMNKHMFIYKSHALWTIILRRTNNIYEMSQTIYAWNVSN